MPVDSVTGGVLGDRLQTSDAQFLSMCRTMCLDLPLATVARIRHLKRQADRHDMRMQAPSFAFLQCRTPVLHLPGWSFLLNKAGKSAPLIQAVKRLVSEQSCSGFSPIASLTRARSASSISLTQGAFPLGLLQLCGRPYCRLRVGLVDQSLG